MTPQERAQRVAEIVKSALDRTPSEALSFVNEACAGNEQIRAEVDSLLNLQAEANEFIEQDPWKIAVEEMAVDDEPMSREQMIGGYKIISRIGSGGMGDVYLAEDIQLRRKVALKLVRAALSTDDVVARFRYEEQILASLNDPNIAHLYGGGVTTNGIPFFVMEYVEGLRIDEYCNRHELSPTARLQLFRKVCSAVNYAHQHLVIHRDLKPSNILVTGEGEPKLLDFGIAKLLKADEATPAVTLAGVMTPDYASPEQVRGEAITTASDVYSLGVILYELLTGHSPYQVKNRNSADIARAITEQDPPRPSTTVTRLTYPKSAIHNPKFLRGDLDNMVLMALRKDPARRYASVAQFSEDVRRHLDGLPVLARNDTFGYRASKFVRRNKAGVAAAAFVTLALLAGIVAIAWGARTARREQIKAQSVSAFLQEMIQYSNPQLDFSRPNSRLMTVADALDEAVQRLESGSFTSDPEVNADLERIIAGTYGGQGKLTEALQHAQKYLDLQKDVYGKNDPRTLSALEIKAWVLFSKGEMVESERVYREALPRMRVGHRAGRVKADDLIGTLNGFGYLRRTQGDSKEAEALFREVLSLKSQVPKKFGYVLMVTRGTLASTLADQGRFDEALATAREAVNEAREAGQADAAGFGFCLTVLGGFLVDRGDFSEGDAILQEGEKVIRDLATPTSLWLGDNLRNQAISLCRQNRFTEVQPKIDETLRIYRDSFGPHYDHYPTVLITQGLVWSKTGRSADAEAILREALKLRTNFLPKEHFWVGIAKGALGEFLATQKRFEEAEPLLNESYAVLKARLGPDDPRTKEASQRLVAFHDSQRGN